jgi:hypothetical protein
MVHKGLLREERLVDPNRGEGAHGFIPALGIKVGLAQLVSA